LNGNKRIWYNFRLSPILLAIGYAKHKRKMRVAVPEGAAGTPPFWKFSYLVT